MNEPRSITEYIANAEDEYKAALRRGMARADLRPGRIGIDVHSLACWDGKRIVCGCGFDARNGAEWKAKQHEIDVAFDYEESE